MSSFLKNMGLMLLSIVMTLAMLEGAVRILKLGTGGFWEPDDQLGWVNIPNAKGWESCYGECQVQVTINSLGLRDEEVTYEKPDGQNRILFLGDSITAGMQVPLEDTFTEQLEGHLAEDTFGEWEVLNGAVNGYGTDNELLYYRLEGHKFEPDIVIVGMYLANDIYNNSRVLELRTGGESHKPYFTLDESGELQLNNFPVEDTDTIGIKIGTFLKKHFQLPRFVAQTMSLRGEVPGWLRPIVTLFSGNRGVRSDDDSATDESTADADAPDTNEEVAAQQRAVSRTEATICDETYTAEIEEAWEITKAVLLELKEEVEASGAEFAVISVPTTAQTVTPRPNATWYCERPNQELNAFLEEAGIPYLDLLQPFRDYSDAGGRELYYARDFHMNEAGHHLAGEEIYNFVTDTFLDG